MQRRSRSGKGSGEMRRKAFSEAYGISDTKSRGTRCRDDRELAGRCHDDRGFAESFLDDGYDVWNAMDARAQSKSNSKSGCDYQTAPELVVRTPRAAAKRQDELLPRFASSRTSYCSARTCLTRMLQCSSPWPEVHDHRHQLSAKRR